MMWHFIGSTYICFAVAISSAANAALTIDTTPSWTPNGGFNQINYFGADGESQVYGQVFTIPATDNILNSFTFYLDDRQSGATEATKFSAHVMKWDTNRATGGFLYSSPMQ